MHGRLLFALCRSCCEEQRQECCNHEDEREREFSGTWVADELKKAVQLGYRVREIYIVWQYEMTSYDQSTGKGGLFAGYVNTFLKLKQEASGWPSWCTDEESKQRYLTEYERDEGIRLEREKIVKNPGLRAVAKMALVSSWGKMAERNRHKQTDIVKTREALLKLLTSPDKEVFNVVAPCDTALYVHWEYREEALSPAPNTNVVIAAYTTAQARLKLYGYLEKLGRRCLYYDTDSCVYVSTNGKDEYTPPLGNLLGDMTDELRDYGDGAYIETFVSGGPKFYAYKVLVPSTGAKFECCKVKGISLNFANALKINFDSIRDLVLARVFNRVDGGGSGTEDTDDDEKAIKINFRAIRRMPTHDVVTRDEVKTCSVVLKKRRYISHDLSLPFGYKRRVNDDEIL